MPEDNQQPQYKESFKLRINYWILDNREFFRKLALFAFIVLDVFLVSIIFLFYANYFRLAKKQVVAIDRLASVTSSLSQWQGNQAPRDILVKNTDYVRAAGGNYDLVARVENANDDWFLESASYKFVWSGGESEIQETFILPGENKYLLALNQSAGVISSRVSLEFVEQDWQWIGTSYNKEIMNKDDIEVVSSNFIDGAEGIPDKATYKVKNNTIYNFWEVDFNIVLYNNSRIVGLNTNKTGKLYSGETDEMENVWAEDISRVDKIVLDPSVNFFDRNIYLPNSATGEPK